MALPRQDSGAARTGTPLSKLLRLLLIKAVVWSMAAGAGCSRDGVDTQPPAGDPLPRNVVFIVIDALRADHMGVYGYTRNTTPNLDRFAAENLVFTRAYSAASWTLPSLASYMTSVYPEVHGLRRPPTEADHFALPDRFLTLAESLKSQGFRTASITSQPWISDKMGLTQGFDEARAVSHASAPAEARVLTDHLVDWLTRNADERFFLYAHYMGPHSPYDVPSSYTGRFTAGLPLTETVAEFHRIYEFEGEADAYRMVTARAREGGLTAADIDCLKAEYDEKLAFTDECLGRLLRHLDEAGRLDDSVVIVTADHGEAFYEHGTIFHGQNLHEELVRVPLILHLPGPAHLPARIEDIVELIDLYPTLHDVLGLPAPRQIQGRSLVPILRGEPGDGVALAECFGFKVITRDWSSFYEYSDSLHLPEGIRAEEIYHLAADPLEQRNLAGSRPDIAAKHRTLALRLWSEMRDVSARHLYETRSAELDEETREKLRSLGYLGGAP